MGYGGAAPAAKKVGGPWKQTRPQATLQSRTAPDELPCLSDLDLPAQERLVLSTHTLEGEQSVSPGTKKGSQRLTGLKWEKMEFGREATALIRLPLCPCHLSRPREGVPGILLQPVGPRLSPSHQSCAALTIRTALC